MEWEDVFQDSSCGQTVRSPRLHHRLEGLRPSKCVFSWAIFRLWCNLSLFSKGLCLITWCEMLEVWPNVALAFW